MSRLRPVAVIAPTLVLTAAPLAAETYSLALKTTHSGHFLEIYAKSMNGADWKRVTLAPDSPFLFQSAHVYVAQVKEPNGQAAWPGSFSLELKGSSGLPPARMEFTMSAGSTRPLVDGAGQATYESFNRWCRQAPGVIFENQVPQGLAGVY